MIKDINKHFRITGGRGFHIKFINGITISVQFGPGQYGDNYDMDIMNFSNGRPQTIESDSVEIAIWDKDNMWLTKEYPGDHEDVMSYIEIKEFEKVLKWCMNK